MELHRVFSMENNNCPQNCLGYQYSPPSFVPNPALSDDNNISWWDTPGWVIVGIVVVVVIICGFLFYNNRGPNGKGVTLSIKPKISLAMDGGS